MISNRAVTVFGAYGHTGRFVVAELNKRGWTPILAGRDVAKLHAVTKEYPGLEARVASVDDDASLDRAIAGSGAVINCAGPFVDTAVSLIEAALRSRIHYLDVAAEQAAVLTVFERFSRAAQEAGIVIVPAMAFFGGLGDLLATAAMGDWDSADEILIGVALNSWNPTQGTRLTGQRNPGRRFTFSNNKLEHSDLPPRTWNFPSPFGQHEVEGLSLAETITISRHLRAPEIHAYMNLAPIRDIHDPSTTSPLAVDESGRSSQIFLMEVIAKRGSTERRAYVRGQDIYAITAPIVVEATQRVIRGMVDRSGVVTAGEAFDAGDFFNALASSALAFEMP